MRWFRTFVFVLAIARIYFHLQHQMLLRYQLHSYKILLEMPRGIEYNTDMLADNQKILYS
jgi:hypothetical protein